MATRNCLARGCKNIRRKDQLMCPGCWAQVPPEIKDEVYETYSQNPGGTARYTNAHYTAVMIAIRSVDPK